MISFSRVRHGTCLQVPPVIFSGYKTWARIAPGNVLDGGENLVLYATHKSHHQPFVRFHKMDRQHFVLLQQPARNTDIGRCQWAAPQSEDRA